MIENRKNKRKGCVKKITAMLLALAAVLTLTAFKQTGALSENGYLSSSEDMSLIVRFGLKPGDVNGDGRADSLDASLVLQSDAGLISFSAEEKAAADVNGDGKADSLDASFILQYDAGLISIFPGQGYAELLPPAEDLGGREFYIMQRWFGYGKPTIDFQGEVIWQDSEDGTMTNVNRAKKKVKDEVERKYNCRVTGELSTDPVPYIRQCIMEDIISETAEYDFCFETPYFYYSFVTDGHLADLNTLGMDFSMPWWDQNAVKDLSICNKLYYAMGDINTYDDDGTKVILFNKRLYSQGGRDYEELYQLAEYGDWTFEEFKKRIEGFGKDSNGDKKMDEFDTYGLLTEKGNLYFHALAAGGKTAQKCSNDEPVFTMDDVRLYNSVSAAVELYLNSKDVLVGDIEQYITKYEGEDVYEKTVINAFKEGRGLFYMTSLVHLPYFRDMNDDFGILPVPKFDNAQDRYYSGVSLYTSSALFVPAGANSRGEKGRQLGVLLDALGAYSKDYLTPEYYEKQLKRGDCSDYESAQMLDIIFAARTFDIGATFSTLWGDAYNLVNQLDTNYASRIAVCKDFIIFKMEDTVAKIKSNS